MVSGSYDSCGKIGKGVAQKDRPLVEYGDFPISALTCELEP